MLNAKFDDMYNRMKTSLKLPHVFKEIMFKVIELIKDFL